MPLMQHGPAEPSPLAHRIARFRSRPRLCWDILSVLELRGGAGCRTCLHLLGNGNGYHSQFKWGNAAGGLKSYSCILRWPGYTFESDEAVRYLTRAASPSGQEAYITYS